MCKIPIIAFRCMKNSLGIETGEAVTLVGRFELFLEPMVRVGIVVVTGDFPIRPRGFYHLARVRARGKDKGNQCLGSGSNLAPKN